MKHLITMTACLLVLMALLSQFVQNQQLLMQLEAGSHAVDLFCEDRDEAALRSSLARVMDCEEREIGLQQGDNRLVITVPVKAILASPEFWGLDSAENQGVYRWEREAEDG